MYYPLRCEANYITANVFHYCQVKNNATVFTMQIPYILGPYLCAITIRNTVPIRRVVIMLVHEVLAYNYAKHGPVHLIKSSRNDVQHRFTV